MNSPSIFSEHNPHSENNIPSFKSDHTVIYHGQSNAHSFPRAVSHQATTPQQHAEVSQPWEHSRKLKNLGNESESKAQVKKVCAFFGENYTYLVVHVTSGKIRGGMKGNINGKQFTITEMQAKLNAPIAVPGMDIGLTIVGATPDEFEKNSELQFDA